MDRYKRRSGKDTYTVNIEDQWQLWQFYALSKISEYLLLPFQMPATGELRGPGDYIASKWFAREGLLERFNRYVAECPISVDDYVAYFEMLGFESQEPKEFNPFDCEIVRVDEAEPAREAIRLIEVLWPALYFGDMLFSRSGVRILAGKDVMDKGVAEESTLYWSYWRLGRETEDLSHGWGSNSQWSTDLRRDYRDSMGTWLNVDYNLTTLKLRFVEGRTEDGMEYRLCRSIDPKREEKIDVAKRIEILRYRSQLKDWGQDEYIWPYYDTIHIPG